MLNHAETLLQEQVLKNDTTNLTLISGGYTTTYPMASYAPGQQVCLAWPTKNHVVKIDLHPTPNIIKFQIFASLQKTIF
jgi:hypothetical protein